MKYKMNTILFGAFLLGSLLLLPAAIAADNTPTITAPTNGFTSELLIQWLTPIIVPLVIAMKKKVMPQLPGWALPVLAPVLGILLDIINSATSTHQNNFLLAALLGLAGVGIREVKDQLLPAKQSPETPGPS